ncbi:WSC domain-containing protein 1 [Mactra antiquata]
MGIFTGSVYADVLGKFPGSKHCPVRGKVFIVKTHMMSYQTKHVECRMMQAFTIQYKKAMYILRNPYEAMVSTFNLVKTRSKVGFARRADFQTESKYLGSHVVQI